MRDLSQWTCKYAASVVLITLCVFVGLGVMNSVLLMGMSYMVYNTTLDCVYNVTECFNPDNTAVFTWAIAASMAEGGLVLLVIGSFVLGKYLYRRWLIRNYVHTTLAPQEEPGTSIEMFPTVNTNTKFDSDSDHDIVSFTHTKSS